MVAILVALGSALVAVYALNVARTAKSSAAAAASDAQRLASRAPAPAPSAAGTPSPTGPPTPVYRPELRGVPLTIPPTAGCQSIYVDVDSGEVGNFAGHEFYFSSCVGPLSVHLDNVDAAVPTGGNTTPETCAVLLRGPTPSSETILQVTPGMTFCLLTQKAAAVRAGIAQHMAVVQIRQVSSDRTVVATLDTYSVPTSPTG